MQTKTRNPMKPDPKTLCAALAVTVMTVILAAPAAIGANGGVTSVFAITAPGVLA